MRHQLCHYDEFDVSYFETEETREQIFQHLLGVMLSNDIFNHEVIEQCDESAEVGKDVLRYLVDMFRFEIHEKEE